MDSLPWVSITQTGQDIGLRIHPHALSDLSISNSATPQVIVLIGKHEKSHILRQLLQLEPRYPQLPHGQVHLWEDPVTKTSENPNIFVDCELFNSTSAQNSNPASYISPELSKKLIWLDHGNLDEVCTYFMNNVLMPISCVIYYFAADLGGTTNVALLLAKQILKGRKASYSKSTLPRVIIILEASNGLLPTDHTKKFLALLTKAVKDLDPLKSDSDAASSIESQFGSIRATCLGQSNRSVRSAAMRGQMQATVYSLIQCRYDLRVLFSFAHIRAFSSILLENFCASKPIDFSFVKASRPRGFSLDDFSYHLGQALDLMPSEAWLWHFVAPLVASCILVSMYRPGSHLFSPSAIYEEIFREKCHMAIQVHTIHEDVQIKFVEDVEKELGRLFLKLTSPDHHSAASVHQEQLVRLRPHISRLRSNRSCLTCLLRMPEKVLSCGHSICEICLQLFGSNGQSGDHTFHLEDCPVCGKFTNRSFRLVPPNAGTRLLSIDGGGVRGVISIIFLRHLHQQLEEFDCPLGEFFDLVCGTSAGGLITLGIFLMQWSADECLSKFLLLAKDIFKPRNTSTSLFSRVQDLLLSYVEDGQYSQKAINEAFTTAGHSIPMFNPLQSHTRVAVTATTAKETNTCLFTNYNGHTRTRNIDNLDYNTIRASRAEFDATISDAARCTSAAPWYFRAQELKNLGTFQDGGLQHNMPMDVAYWEKENIWPEKQGLDFGISIGTGTRKVPITSSLGHQSPVKQGCASRMFNAFLERIDGQREWWRFRNSLCPTIRKRIYRLNIPLTKEPSIDDISSIPALQKQTEDYLGTISGHLTDIMDSIYASMFYFELDSVPEYIDGIYHCHGFVLCRLNLTQKGLLHLYHWLVTGSAFFLINGRPVACARLIPKGTPSFRCRIQFTVPDLEEQLGISIRGVTSKPSIISGLPQSILALIENQVMDAPFGRVGHSPSRKALPRIPQKRKLSETSKNTHFLSCY